MSTKSKTFNTTHVFHEQILFQNLVGENVEKKIQL